MTHIYRLKHVHRTKKRIGKSFKYYYYWRRPDWPRQKLPDDPLSPEFIRRVCELNEAADKHRKVIIKYQMDSFGHLVTEFLASSEYQGLREKTKYEYKYYLDMLCGKFGHLPYSGITREFVKKLKDSFSKTPAKANAVIRTLRRVLSFALDNEWIEKNPAERPKLMRLARRKTVWTNDKEKLWLSHADKRMRMGYFLAAYTAQRRGDIIKMEWSQYNGKKIALRQEKTGELVWVTVHRDLKRELDSYPRDDKHILLNSQGNPYTADDFSHKFHAVTKAAGLEDVQLRDLRRTAMVRMAEAGCTAIEVAAVSGHSIERTTEILETYIPRNAKMASIAIAKWENSVKSSKKIVNQ